jgi:hypothetical protein
VFCWLARLAQAKLFWLEQLRVKLVLHSSIHPARNSMKCWLAKEHGEFEIYSVSKAQ